MVGIVCAVLYDAAKITATFPRELSIIMRTGFFPFVNLTVRIGSSNTAVRHLYPELQSCFALTLCKDNGNVWVLV